MCEFLCLTHTSTKLQSCNLCFLKLPCFYLIYSVMSAPNRRTALPISLCTQSQVIHSTLLTLILIETRSHPVLSSFIPHILFISFRFQFGLNACHHVVGHVLLTTSSLQYEKSLISLLLCYSHFPQFYSPVNNQTSLAQFSVFSRPPKNLLLTSPNFTKCEEWNYSWKLQKSMLFELVMDILQVHVTFWRWLIFH